MVGEHLFWENFLWSLKTRKILVFEENILMLFSKPSPYQGSEGNSEDLVTNFCYLIALLCSQGSAVYGGLCLWRQCSPFCGLQDWYVTILLAKEHAGAWVSPSAQPRVQWLMVKGRNEGWVYLTPALIGTLWKGSSVSVHPLRHLKWCSLLERANCLCS